MLITRNSLLLAVLVPSVLALAPGANAQAACSFVLGFGSLRDAVGVDVVGSCLEDQHFTPIGNAEQQTTGGLLVWRKADNWTAFTDGNRTWLSGPNGVEARLNGERFPWEVDVGASTSAPVSQLSAPPVPAPPAHPAVLSVADVAERVSLSVVQVRVPGVTGSGVAIPEGILTNAHVVEGAQTAELLLSDGRRVAALVVRRDPTADLALLTTSERLPALGLATAAAQRQGDQVLVLGYPAGIGGQATLTTGIISATRREGEVVYIQTDAAINHGNSGGALVNMQGHLIGLPTFFLRDNQNLGFAVAGETISEFLAGRVLPSTALVATATPATSRAPAPSPTPSRPRVRDLMLPASAFGDGFKLTSSACAASAPSCTNELFGPWAGGITAQLLELPDVASARESLARDVSASLRQAGVSVTEAVSTGPPGSRLTVARDTVGVTTHLFAVKGVYRMDLSSSVHRFGYGEPIHNWLGDVMKAWSATLPD